MNRGLVVVRDGDRVKHQGACFKHDLQHRPKRGKMGTDRTVKTGIGDQIIVSVCEYEGCLLYTSPSPRDRG